MYFSTERSRNIYIDVKFDGESIFDVYNTFWEDFGTQKYKKLNKNQEFSSFSKDFLADSYMIVQWNP